MRTVHVLVSFWVDPSIVDWEKGLVKCHISASQVLNAPTYWTTLAPTDALQGPNFCNQYKSLKLIALNLLLKPFTQLMDARKSRFAPNTPDPLCAKGTSVEFVLDPQHETSCDPETTTKEDFDYLRKIN